MSVDALFTRFFSEIHDNRQPAKNLLSFYDVLFLTVCAVIGGAQGWRTSKTWRGPSGMASR